MSELFAEYRSLVPANGYPEGKQAVRLQERIVTEYIYLTKRVVGAMKRHMPPHVEADDLESLAKIGLMQAISRFNPDRGVPFEAYATQNMKSKIMDGIRDADWAPRSLRKKQRDMRKAEEAYKNQYKCEPSNDELAEFMEWPVDEIHGTRYKVGIATHTYIEGNIEAQNKPSSLNDEEDALVHLMRHSLVKAYDDLPIQLAAVVALHYFEEKKLADVARLLRISEARAGALHAEAVLEIWDALQCVLADE